ncbi:MAG: antibiotic biosynthesis monooxygenase [Deltaproteobacteria bacterium]
MLAKILIKRRFKSGRTKEIVSLLNDMRSAAMRQPGYISGLTLMEPENPKMMLVIGTWHSIEAWNQWKAHTDRTRLDAMLEIHQEGSTQYEVFVVGTGFSL